ncbi:MAG: hypothetical protein PHX18_02100 [Candidatus Gastranaerophilales bacterium]|nr:hypothetical protein [Candidatus Gastranaerophilales bacterium]
MAENIFTSKSTLGFNQIQNRLNPFINFEDLDFISTASAINNFKQGETGDCWLLGALTSINQIPKGRRLLQNILKPLPNGDVQVTLIGAAKSYIITKEEIRYIPKLSSGCEKVKALEIAVLKHQRSNWLLSLKYTMCNAPYGKKRANMYDTGFMPSSYGSLDTNYDEYAMFLLTGFKPNDYFNKEDELEKALPELEKNKKSYAITVSFHSGEDDFIYNGQIFMPHHSYAVKEFRNEFFVLINPYDTSKEWFIPYKEVKKHKSSIVAVKIA